MQINLKMVGPIKLHKVKLNENQWTDIKKYISNKNEQTNAIDYNLEKRIEIPTGSYDGFKLKNIYDLAGNMWELTTEVREDNTKTIAVSRGGGFGSEGHVRPLCYRSGNNDTLELFDVQLGFRVVLYVQ